MGPTARPCLIYQGASLLDDAEDGAALDLARCLAGVGFSPRVLGGWHDSTGDDPALAVERLGWACEIDDGGPLAATPEGVSPERPRRLRMSVGGVPVEMPYRPRGEDGPDGADDLRRLFLAAIGDARPEVVVILGGGSVGEIIGACRDRGIVCVLVADGPIDRITAPAVDPDAAIAHSRAMADYLREAFGWRAEVLPSPVAVERARVEVREPTYLTFVDPTPGRGAFPFARIAEALGRRRPDIPILVVEGEGTEETLAGCGLDLTARGTVAVMSPTRDPRKYWRLTRLLVAPALGCEDQPGEVIGALVNGIPVIGSDRGGLPETLGEGGVVLPLPDRLTPATRLLPTAEEVTPWVDAILRLWDDAALRGDYERKGSAEARRWSPDVVGPAYARFLASIRPAPRAPAVTSAGRSRRVVLVPHHGAIEGPCEAALRGLEAEGVEVRRRGGSSAIDVARNEMASEALHDGFESILFIDSDLSFAPRDALRLLARPEPVVSGVYAKKGDRDVASLFAEGVDELLFGAGAPGLYPLRYAATGFLRIRADVLRRMIEELPLPLCNTRWDRGFWPFFMPIVVRDGKGHHYLPEDWSFSHRLHQIGVTPMADTSIRLWHHGLHPFGWEDAGEDRRRYATYTFRLK